MSPKHRTYQISVDVFAIAIHITRLFNLYLTIKVKMCWCFVSGFPLTLEVKWRNCDWLHQTIQPTPNLLILSCFRNKINTFSSNIWQMILPQRTQACTTAYTALCKAKRVLQNQEKKKGDNLVRHHNHTSLQLCLILITCQMSIFCCSHLGFYLPKYSAMSSSILRWHTHVYTIKLN